MTFLLDSNALLWATYAPQMLKSEVIALLQDRSNTVLVSYVSVWELLAKIGRGKLLMAGSSVDDAYKSILQLGFTILPILETHLLAAAKLPHIHSDPFDRMLIAQAIEAQAVIISSDGLLEHYGVSVLAI